MLKSKSWKMNNLITSLLLLLGTYTSMAQSQRFLEKRTFKEGSAAAGYVVLSPSTNIDNSKLAVTNTYYDPIKILSKPTANSTLLNLLTGRMEANFNDNFLLFLGNELLYADMVTYKYSYFIPETREKTAIEVPKEFWIMGTHGKYIIASNFKAQKSLLLEIENGVTTVKHKFDLGFLKISSDSTKVYGKKTYSDHTIWIYELESGRKIKSVKSTESFEFQMLNNGKFVTSSLNTISIIDEMGKPTLEFTDTGISFTINDIESEIISINAKGVIKLWDISSGKKLAEVTDTYIGQSISNKRISAPFKVSGGEFYLIPYSNGIISVFSSKERKVVANLFFDELDWAIIAKDGRIDGTQGAFEKLEWREYDGDKLVRTASVESSFDKYYTPRLLYTILNGDEPIAPDVNAVKTITIDEDMKQVPALEWLNVNDKTVTREAGNVATYSSMQKSITLRLKVTANMDRIKEVRLYHNGKLVGNQPANGTASYTFSASLNSLFGDANSIYAIASTKDGLDSEKCKLTVTYSEKDKTKAKLYALVVGINKYQNPRYELNYALPDATAIKNQLEKGGSALFESIVVKTLFEGQATKANVISAFKEMSSTVQEQDMFIFYYAGHGTMSESPANEFYIVPQDVTQLYGNETLLKEKAISASEIKKLSMAINAQKQVFIIDACHSAGALNSAVTRGAAEEKAIGQLARSTGTFWLTAAGSDQFATEFAQLGHGVFTYSLLEALQGKDAATITDGSLTIRELSTYIEQRVPELSAKYKGTAQYPASFSFGNDFPILIFRVKN